MAFPGPTRVGKSTCSNGPVQDCPRESMLSYRPFGGKLGPWHGFFLLLLCAGWAWGEVSLDRMLLLATKRYGNQGAANVIAWRDLLITSTGQSDATKLKRVNDFFNQKIQFSDDIRVWGMPDYWATPLEVLGRQAGDCEDFAVAKYVTLKLMGIPSAKMRLNYVKARLGGPQSQVVQAHMVLSYYQAPEDEPLILDNLISDIRPASRRTDLTTVYGFNAEGLWVGGSLRLPPSTQRLSRWQSVLMRLS